MPSVLRRCWLGGRKGIQPVQNCVVTGGLLVGAGVVICLERGADLHVSQLMPLPLTASCFSKIRIGFTFSEPAHPGSPGQTAVKRLCVCVYAVCPNQMKLYLLKTHHISMQQVMKAVDEQGQQGSKEHIPTVTLALTVTLLSRDVQRTYIRRSTRRPGCRRSRPCRCSSPCR